MKRIVVDKSGTISVLAVVILSLLTILGICVSNISRVDTYISRNEAMHRNDFYISEGGISREAQEIGNGSYPVRDINRPEILVTEKSTNLPKPSPHEVLGSPYMFTLQYSGMFVPPKGFSAVSFNRYDYDIDVNKNETIIRARYYKIGPKVD